MHFTSSIWIAQLLILYKQGFPILAKRGLQRAASRPLPEREAAHLGDAIAGPRTLHFSQPPPAAAGRSGKPAIQEESLQ